MMTADVLGRQGNKLTHMFNSLAKEKAMAETVVGFSTAGVMENETQGEKWKRVEG